MVSIICQALGGGGGDAHALAAALSAMSSGRQPPLSGADLAAINGRVRGGGRLMLLAGAEDAKFVAGARAVGACRC